MWEIAICCVLLGEVNQTQPEFPAAAPSREVDDLARQYRIQVYKAFRMRRETYNQWAAAGAQVLEFSRVIPAQSPEQQQLAEWFRRATVASQSDQMPPQKPEIDWENVASRSAPADATQTLETASPPQLSTRPARPTSSLPWGASGLFGLGGHGDATPVTDRADAPNNDALPGGATTSSTTLTTTEDAEPGPAPDPPAASPSVGD